MYLAGIELKAKKQSYDDFVRDNKIKAYTLEAEFLGRGYHTSNYDLLAMPV